MAFIDDIAVEISLTARLREQLVQAARAFSGHQQTLITRTGVSLLIASSLPPEIAEACPEIRLSAESLGRGEAQYLPELRLLQVREDSNQYIIRHELTHAWDHVRQGRVRSLRGLPEARRCNEIGRRQVFWSDTHLVGMFRLYRQRAGRTVDARDRYAFDLRSGYSTRSPREFYAEGYNVFHSNQVFNQAKLLRYAPELYDLLEWEARNERLPVPERATLQAEIDRLRLPPAPQ
jgi:hypothetical protein